MIIQVTRGVLARTEGHDSISSRSRPSSDMATSSFARSSTRRPASRGSSA
jgi:hypothetical protein